MGLEAEKSQKKARMATFGPGARRRGSHNSGRLYVLSSLANSPPRVNTCELRNPRLLPEKTDVTLFA
jgi:hypothetical protein